jgi:hypothetical protein
MQADCKSTHSGHRLCQSQARRRKNVLFAMRSMPSAPTTVHDQALLAALNEWQDLYSRRKRIARLW